MGKGVARRVVPVCSWEVWYGRLARRRRRVAVSREEFIWGTKGGQLVQGVFAKGGREVESLLKATMALALAIQKRSMLKTINMAEMLNWSDEARMDP